MKNKYFIYIVIGAYNLSGVRSKLAGKIQALNQELGEVKCLYFCNDIREIMQEGNITFIPFYFDGEIPNFWKKAIFWRFQEYYIRKQKFKIINNTLKQLNQFSGIVFRYIPSDFNSLIFGLKYFKKIIYEHNTFESEELKLIRNSTVKQYYQISEKLFGPFVRMFAKCLISVTKEISIYEQKLAFSLVKSYTVTNGIAMSNYPLTTIKKYREGDVLHVLFTSGYGNIWHGVDLLIKSLQGNSNAVLHLVGEFHEDIHKNLQENVASQVVFYGKLSGIEYDEIFEKAHIAVTSLAMYRIGLTEGAVLKTREYTARGIPFVLGHDDSDFTDSAIVPFVLKMDVNEQHLINFDTVKQFLLSIQNRNYSEMRTYAEHKLNYTAKAKEYKEIIEKHFK